MKKLNERDFDVLSDILSKHYFTPYMKDVLVPARFEMITENILVDEPYTQWEEEYDDTDSFLFRSLRHPLALLILLFKLFFGSSVIIAKWAIVKIRREEGGPEFDDMKVLYLESMDNFYLATRRKTMVEVEYVRQVEKTITHEVEIEPEHTVQEEVRSTTRVLSIGRGNLMFNAWTSPNGVLVTGPHQINKSHEIRYPVLNDIEPIFESINEIEKSLEAIPWVLDGEVSTYSTKEETDYGGDVPLRGLEKEIRDHYELIQNSFASISYTAVYLDIINDLHLLSYLVPNDNMQPKKPSWLDSLIEQVEAKGGSDLEEIANTWISNWGHINNALFVTRKTSLCDQIAPECFDLGTFLNYSAFNFYCPECNKSHQQEILTRDYSVHSNQINEPVYFSKNTRCVYDLDNEVWRCLTCENETKHPIPIHKMLDGVLLPAYDHLMEEHKVERLKAHKEVRDREIERSANMETELQQIQYNNIAQINVLTEEMERFKSDIAGEQLAINSMQEILDAYQVKQTNVMKEIESFSEHVYDEIQKRTDKVLRQVDELKEHEMELLNEKLGVISRAKRLEDERRDAIQCAILQANIEQVKATDELIAAVDHNTRTTQKGLEDVKNSQDKGNAIAAATAAQLGAPVTDSSWLDPFNKLNQMGEEIIGTWTGRPRWKTEKAKLE